MQPLVKHQSVPTRMWKKKKKTEEKVGKNRKIKHKQRVSERGLQGFDNQNTFLVFLLGEKLFFPRLPLLTPPPLCRISSPDSIGARPEIIRDGEQTRKGDIGRAL